MKGEAEAQRTKRDSAEVVLEPGPALLPSLTAKGMGQGFPGRWCV